MKHITNTALPLWVQATQLQRLSELISQRFIPVPTGNTHFITQTPTVFMILILVNRR
jgi:hypothetical protein